MPRADLARGAARRGPLRPALLFGGLLLAGCLPAETSVRVNAPQGYSVSFPGHTIKMTGRDGPVFYRLDAMRTRDSARLEAAWFGFPQELTPEDRRELLGAVERGLAAGGAEVVKRLEVPPGNKDHIDLVLDHKDGRRGYHHILYLGPTSMLQVSAVGNKGGDWEDIVFPFFGSLEVRAPDPPAVMQKR